VPRQGCGLPADTHTCACARACVRACVQHLAEVLERFLAAGKDAPLDPVALQVGVADSMAWRVTFGG